MDIALVTCADLPQLARDDQLLQLALQQRNHQVDAVIWDDSNIDWQQYDTVVVRSCWDYHHRIDAFLAWVNRLEQLSVVVWNPPALLRWNHEKRYLLELAAQGTPCVPTIYLAAGSHIPLTTLLQQQNWADAVIKPAIAATAFHTWRTTIAQASADQPRFARLLAERAMLIQPLMPQITAGEWSFMFFAGTFSHAVLKRPAVGDFRSQDDFGGTAEYCEPPVGAVEQAAQLLGRLTTPWLYARVDGLIVETTFTLMELELIEPFLFLGLAPHAVAMFAEAIEHLAGNAAS
jgi:glutathione synthase/RimK-type ligase-like ATP-grasp enzyme